MQAEAGALRYLAKRLEDVPPALDVLWIVRAIRRIAALVVADFGSIVLADAALLAASSRTDRGVTLDSSRSERGVFDMGREIEESIATLLSSWALGVAPALPWPRVPATRQPDPILRLTDRLPRAFAAGSAVIMARAGHTDAASGRTHTSEELRR